MSNLKYKLEALLFSSARSMTLEELSNLTKASPEEIREKINEIKKEYEERDSSIALIDEGNSFKLNIKSEHAPIIQQIVTETELSKTLMETLAIIAFKYPIKQSDLIKIRTNKAYDHLRELEELGYITRQKYSRTKLIKLTPKFFEYFDLPQDKIKEKFQGFEGIAKAIGEKEQEIKKMKEEIKKKAKEAGKKGKENEEIDLIDKEGHKQKLEVYEETEQESEEQEAKEVKPYTEKVGNLEVTDVPEKEEVEEPEETTEEETEEVEEPEVEGIKMTEEMGKNVVDQVKNLVKSVGEENKPKTAGQVEREVNERVEEMLHPKETEEEPTEEQPETEEQSQTKETEEKPKESTEEEPKDLLEAAEEEEEKKEEKTKDENLHP